jgi:phosphatidate cytidylyltransferase
MILLVLLCQTLVYKEITALFELRDGGSIARLIASVSAS